MEIKKIFKKQLKDNCLVFRVDERLKNLIKESAKINGVTYSEVMRSSLIEYFEIDD